jgi:hypothetical protein
MQSSRITFEEIELTKESDRGFRVLRAGIDEVGAEFEHRRNDDCGSRSLFGSGGVYKSFETLPDIGAPLTRDGGEKSGTKDRNRVFINSSRKINDALL